MLNKQSNQNPQQSEPKELFPAFPAPRVWHLGWEGDAWTGTLHGDSTADFMLPSADGAIAIDNEKPAQ